jgi:DNA polymerase I
MKTMSRLPASRFPYLYFVDTEFQAVDGEQQKPVSLIAHGYNKGRRVEMFFDSPQLCPFPDLENTLFVGYNLPAEYQTMLALGWPLPAYSIDLYTEYLNIINGVWRGKETLKDIGSGLQDAVREYGGNLMKFWPSDKEVERNYIIKNGVIPPAGVSPEAHRKRILDYNEEDVVATAWLCAQMLPEIDLDQALWRGAYSKATAHFEHNGVPINKERFHTIDRESRHLKLAIANKIEDAHHYGVYAVEGRDDLKTKPHAVFKIDRFADLLASNGITVGKRGAWRVTPTGHPVLEDDYFGDMCNVYPEFQPLRQCRKSINSLGRFGTQLGTDGFNRAPLWMYGTVTGRNNPKAKAFLLSRPHWVRNLITPREGMAIVACDITGAEDWLAAGFSGDPELMRIYASGADSYMEFAIACGAVPEGTKRNKKNAEMESIRAMHKTAKLAIAYGVWQKTLSEYLGVPEYKAANIINSHKSAYGVYWQWTEDRARLAEDMGFVVTDFGWRQSIEHMSANSILNFPQQAGCMEILHCACNLLVERGWGYAMSAPHHDALYMHVEIERAEECKEAVESAFVEAGHIIMELPDFPLRVHGEIVRFPDHYHDPDGAEIWNIVSEYFKWDDFEQEKENVTVFTNNS